MLTLINHPTIGSQPIVNTPVKTRCNHWAGDTSLVNAGVGWNPTCYQIFLIIFDLALDLEESELSSIH